MDPYIRKVFRLCFLGAEIESTLIPFGIRSYIVEQFKGVAVSGAVQRRYDNELQEQVIWVWITATSDILAVIERDLLYCYTYWQKCDQIGDPEVFDKCSHKFVILPNADAYVESGPGSDHMYDYNDTSSHGSVSSSVKSKGSNSTLPSIGKS